MKAFEEFALSGADLTSLGGARRRVDPTMVYPRLGDYELIEQVRCGPPEECFRAIQRNRRGFITHFFLRTFPRQLLTNAATEALQLFTSRYHDPTDDFETRYKREFEGVFHIGIEADRGFIASEYVAGASITDLARAIPDRMAPISWRLALALFCAALTRLVRMHSAGLAHGGISPARIRLTILGDVFVCLGLPASADITAAIASPEQRARDLLSLARAVFPLAAGPEAEKITALLTDDEPQTLAVLSDFILEREPGLGEPIVEILWPLGEDHSDLKPAVADRMAERAVLAVHPGEIRQLLMAVARHSPDLDGSHRHLGSAT